MAAPRNIIIRKRTAAIKIPWKENESWQRKTYSRLHHKAIIFRKNSLSSLIQPRWNTRKKDSCPGLRLHQHRPFILRNRASSPDWINAAIIALLEAAEFVVTLQPL